MGKLFEDIDFSAPQSSDSPLQLVEGSRVAVIGGGPAGSFFSYFLKDMAERMGRDIAIDVYEPRDFSGVGPASCNMCGGIISESLVQNLAAEGINLPTTVVQRGIDSYVLHMDVGSTLIETPMNEMRIGSVYRATGPRDLKEVRWHSFDGFLLNLASRNGVRLIKTRVENVRWEDRRPRVVVNDGSSESYDLLVVAVGVNSTSLKMFTDTGLEYEPPTTTKTFIREFYLGLDTISRHVGSSMHVFLLNIPGVEFAAIIPKGDYVSICLLGDKVDKTVLNSFLDSTEVKNCMPPGWESAKISCQCSPKMSIRGAVKPFGDRLVFVGDSGVTRLFKDGIGAAYRTAKMAATTAVFHGVTESDFERHYWPVCQAIENDNSIGRLLFKVTELIQKRRFARRAVYHMVESEQALSGHRRLMSMILWDLFTGSATYREILKRALRPAFLARFLWDVGRGLVTRPGRIGDGIESAGELDK
jgi:flavin-dependent dehydrogenase